MSVRIRLARGGAKKRPVHKIVVADKRCRRDGRYIEELGFYNPLLPKDSQDALRINTEAAKKWMAQGAEITERVQKLFALVAPGLHQKQILLQNRSWFLWAPICKTSYYHSKLSNNFKYFFAELSPLNSSICSNLQSLN